MQKIISLAFFLIIAATLARGQQSDAKLEEKVFNQWLKKHNINVPPNADLNKWKTNVIKKFKELEAHNEKYRKGEKKFKKALDFLAHLDPAERQARLSGNLKPDPTLVQDQVPVIDKSLLKDLPDYWDWNDKGVIQPVTWQGQCSDCYVMAGIAAIEAHACIYNNVCEKLSELDNVECTEHKCDPGYFYEAFNATINAGGAALESDYPYPMQVNVDDMDPSKLKACNPSARKRVKGTKVLGWKSLPADADTMRYYLYKQGPMYVGFQAYDNLQDYKTGVYHETEGASFGHAVLLTGYGTENGMDYWIFKNSWSTYKGEEGYFKIQRGVNLADFESGYATYPLMDTSFT